MAIEADDAAIADFWARHGQELGGGGQPHHFWFGDSPALADELAALVVSGPKRATAGLLRDFGGDEPLPEVGQRWIVLDGAGLPVAVIETMQVRIGPLSSVTDQFAWDEGEGDRTRTGWLADHHAYFRRQAEREGFTFDPDIDTVFERFELVWPGAAADG